MKTTTLCSLLLSALCGIYGSAPQAEDFDGKSLLFARLRPPTPQTTSPQPEFQRLMLTEVQQAADVQAPLGSVWKLFVYAYAIDRAIPMPDYQCQGGALAKEELFCCNPGESVTRDAALAQSCGLFFAPERLHFDAADWKKYWQGKTPGVAWLADLRKLNPALKINVSSLLEALHGIDGEARAQAEIALLSVVINGRGQGALSQLGGRYRVKTYTWDHPQGGSRVVGGAAGWLGEGSAVWFGALGSSKKVMHDYAQQLALAAEESRSEALSGRCVDVSLFAKYPIKRITALPQGTILEAGLAQDLRGRFLVEFVNGNSLKFRSSSETRVEWQDGSRPKLFARLDENEYLGRVIDREANATSKEAARALSVVARTYLLQNANKHHECLAISDSSHTQRVSPSPATSAARDIAAFTAGLVLQGVDAQYRLNSSRKNVLSWQHAEEKANSGMLFDEILRQSFAQASLATVHGETDCRSLAGAERWLRIQSRQWRKLLQQEAGFTEPKPQICQLAYGKPYSDMSRQRIYVRGLHSLDSRLTLAHEYLHLAFAGYPSGQDEIYIEHWARRLIEGASQI